MTFLLGRFEESVGGEVNKAVTGKLLLEPRLAGVGPREMLLFHPFTQPTPVHPGDDLSFCFGGSQAGPGAAAGSAQIVIRGQGQPFLHFLFANGIPVSVLHVAHGQETVRNVT